MGTSLITRPRIVAHTTLQHELRRSLDVTTPLYDVAFTPPVFLGPPHQECSVVLGATRAAL